MPAWVTNLFEKLRTSWQRSLLATVCFAIVLARMIWPHLTMDWMSVALLAIAFFACLAPRYRDALPHLLKALPYVQRVKGPGFEVELREEIRILAENVANATVLRVPHHGLTLPTDYPAGEAEVLQEIRSDPRAALLLLAAKIEHQVIIRLTKRGLHKEGEFIPLSNAIERGVQQGVFPREILLPFKQFWKIRNEVAHGKAFDVDSAIIMSLVSIGLEVLKLVSIEGDTGSAPASDGT